MEERSYQSLTRHLANILNRVAWIEARSITFFKFLRGKRLFSTYHMSNTHILAHLRHLLFSGHTRHQIGYSALHWQLGVGIIRLLFC